MRSHLLPRTRAGRLVLTAILALFFLLQWPVLPLVDQVVLGQSGIPLLIIWLTTIFLILTAILLYMANRGL